MDSFSASPFPNTRRWYSFILAIQCLISQTLAFDVDACRTEHGSHTREHALLQVNKERVQQPHPISASIGDVLEQNSSDSLANYSSETYGKSPTSPMVFATPAPIYRKLFRELFKFNSSKLGRPTVITHSEDKDDPENEEKDEDKEEKEEEENEEKDEEKEEKEEEDNEDGEEVRESSSDHLHKINGRERNGSEPQKIVNDNRVRKKYTKPKSWESPGTASGHTQTNGKGKGTWKGKTPSKEKGKGQDAMPDAEGKGKAGKSSGKGNKDAQQKLLRKLKQMKKQINKQIKMAKKNERGGDSHDVVQQNMIISSKHTNKRHDKDDHGKKAKYRKDPSQENAPKAKYAKQKKKIHVAEDHGDNIDKLKDKGEANGSSHDTPHTDSSWAWALHRTKKSKNLQNKKDEATLPENKSRALHTDTSWTRALLRKKNAQKVKYETTLAENVSFPIWTSMLSSTSTTTELVADKLDIDGLTTASINGHRKKVKHKSEELPISSTAPMTEGVGVSDLHATSINTTRVEKGSAKQRSAEKGIGSNTVSNRESAEVQKNSADEASKTHKVSIGEAAKKQKDSIDEGNKKQKTFNLKVAKKQNASREEARKKRKTSIRESRGEATKKRETFNGEATTKSKDSSQKAKKKQSTSIGEAAEQSFRTEEVNEKQRASSEGTEKQQEFSDEENLKKQDSSIAEKSGMRTFTLGESATSEGAETQQEASNEEVLKKQESSIEEKSTMQTSTLGESAALDEVGYQSLVSLCCPEQMTKFIKRVIAQEDLFICDEGGVSGTVWWFDCADDNQTYDSLVQTLHDGTEGPCPYLRPGPEECRPRADDCKGGDSQLPGCGEQKSVQYIHMEESGACSIEGPIEHERCHCKNRDQSFCKNLCDADSDCKGYASAPNGGCDVATISPCDQTCHKINSGNVGMLVTPGRWASGETTAHYGGCWARSPCR